MGDKKEIHLKIFGGEARFIRESVDLGFDEREAPPNCRSWTTLSAILRRKFTIKQVVEKTVLQGRQAFFGFVDLQIAFYRVPRSLLGKSPKEEE